MEKNKKKTLTISGGIGKKISSPKPGLKQEKKVFNVYKKSHKVIFLKSLAKALQNQLISQVERIFQENLPNNKQQKDLFILIQETL